MGQDRDRPTRVRAPGNFTDRIESGGFPLRHAARPGFFRLVRDFTGKVPGEGGLITFADSAWLASIVLPHQPHFIGQPDDVEVFWGYGLRVDAPGDFVKKPMAACTGREILTEILGQLHIENAATRILKSSICIPCMMPFITSQFLTREKGDRPAVVPTGTENLASRARRTS
jgi:oleate hydratase